MMKKVLVLMSTYNGEKYLRTQIDSILTQEEVDVYLFVRDDGSRDSTLQILEEYSIRHENFEFIKGNNVGFVQSFSTLVRLAVDYGAFDYYAFSDQDDIWYNNKLKTAVAALQKTDESIPILFASNCMLVNKDGVDIRLLRNQDLHYREGNCLYSGSVQGCSMAFNRKALTLYAKHLPVKAYHDTWMLYICGIFGKVLYDITPLFAYRIHDNNTLGLGHKNKGNIFEKIHHHLKGIHPSYYLNSVSEFRESFINELSGDDLRILDDFLNYRTNISSKLRLLIKPQYGSLYNGLKPRLLFYKNVIFNTL